MRYFTIVPERKETVDNQEMTVSYKKLFEQMLCADMRMATEAFMKAAEIYARFKAAKEGDVFEIEDHDYSVVVKPKLDAFIQSAVGVTVGLPWFLQFLKDVKDMPTQDPRKAKLEAVK